MSLSGDPASHRGLGHCRSVIDYTPLPASVPDHAAVEEDWGLGLPQACTLLAVESKRDAVQKQLPERLILAALVIVTPLKG